jgi:hypothetical protein
MRCLPVVIFAAAIAIWGLASIPEGSGNGKTGAAYRRGELARRLDGAFPAPTEKAATLALLADRETKWKTFQKRRVWPKPRGESERDDAIVASVRD